jgi:hypothetical protein
LLLILISFFISSSCVWHVSSWRKIQTLFYE